MFCSWRLNKRFTAVCPAQLKWAEQTLVSVSLRFSAVSVSVAFMTTWRTKEIWNMFKNLFGINVTLNSPLQWRCCKRFEDENFNLPFQSWHPIGPQRTCDIVLISYILMDRRFSEGFWIQDPEGFPLLSSASEHGFLWARTGGVLHFLSVDISFHLISRWGRRGWRAALLCVCVCVC